ncbi:L,D-transpeptidase family protein [Streptomyces sp. NPDC050636]|uniref:L,D-transpeptidase family protein n=1 Tax=Streptomyces sp. NPDC050636 TaxID=3154510 RepID=UPI003415B6EB
MPLTRTRTTTAGSGKRGGSGRSGARTKAAARATATPATAALLSAVCAAGLLAVASPASATPPATPPAQTAADRIPLPYRMADTGGGDQLITARAPRKGSTTGTVKWWQWRNGRWHQAGSAPARFGSGGLTEGSTREQGTSTTPTGLYDLPFAFGIDPAPDGTTTPYRRVRPDSWWCEDNASTSYNRWVEPRPRDCAAAESERLADYPTQYSRALVIGFNYHRPVHGRGAGIFLHVNGKGATAGCVSVPARAMARILSWVRPSEHPHIAIGTAHGPTAITRY